jgi:hypothetical protein
LGVVETFSGHGVQRLLGIARGAAAFMGGVLVAVLATRATREGVSVAAGGLLVVAVVLLASRRVPAP